jgi:hypothetical protein
MMVFESAHCIYRVYCTIISDRVSCVFGTVPFKELVNIDHLWSTVIAACDVRGSPNLLTESPLQDLPSHWRNVHLRLLSTKAVLWGCAALPVTSQIQLLPSIRQLSLYNSLDCLASESRYGIFQWLDEAELKVFLTPAQARC